jgi:hypothetical protein
MSDIKGNKGNKGGEVQDKDIDDKALKAMFDSLGGSELSLERNIYKADSCGNVPVVGYFIDMLDMPEADRKDNPDWRAFIVELTHPTKVVNRKGDVVMAKAGEEIIFPAGFQIEGALKRFAIDPRNVHELGVLPGDKIPLGGGKNLRTFRVKVTGNQMVRTAIHSFDDKSVSKTLSAAGVRQLQGGDGAVDSDGRVS